MQKLKKEDFIDILYSLLTAHSFFLLSLIIIAFVPKQKDIALMFVFIMFVCLVFISTILLYAVTDDLRKAIAPKKNAKENTLDDLKEGYYHKL